MMFYLPSRATYHDEKRDPRTSLQAHEQRRVGVVGARVGASRVVAGGVASASASGVDVFLLRPLAGDGVRGARRRRRLHDALLVPLLRPVQNLDVLLPQAQKLAHAVRFVRHHVLQLARVVRRHARDVVRVVQGPVNLDVVPNRRRALQRQHRAHGVRPAHALRLDAQTNRGRRGLLAAPARAPLGGEPTGRHRRVGGGGDGAHRRARRTVTPRGDRLRRRRQRRVRRERGGCGGFRLERRVVLRVLRVLVTFGLFRNRHAALAGTGVPEPRGNRLVFGSAAAARAFRAVAAALCELRGGLLFFGV
mmetsp:Transcript_1751/g.7046  ORF Transcript_1751/g.7046 Transcript_1751/m.7046 type:complete len:306 (+) Transcript_1751:51-968(+)